MCRVVATFSERRSIVAESLPIDRQRGAVSEPFEMIAARDAADEVEPIAETEPVVGQKCVGALRSDGEEEFVVFAAGYGGFEIDGSRDALGIDFGTYAGPVQDMPQLVARLTAGMAVLLLEGCSSGIVFSVQGLKFRSVEEPSGEGNLRGSREGFTDLLRVNLSLLRRLVRTDTLMQEAAQAHTCCNTEYALCYCKDRADPAMVQRVRAILQSARPELLLDSSCLLYTSPSPRD